MGLGFALRCFMLCNFKTEKIGDVLMNIFLCKNKEKMLLSKATFRCCTYILKR